MDEITLTTLNMALLRPIVDGIICRYNIAEGRAEAGAAAVVLLEVMRTMGVFGGPPVCQEALDLPKRPESKDMKAPGYELKRGHPSDVT